MSGLVALTLRVLQVCAPEEANGLELRIMRRKADVREIEGAQWFSKACPSEKFATVLYASSKSKKKQLYCYRGSGSLDANAAEAAAGIVCFCKQWGLASALHCALKLGMCCCPFGPMSNADPILCHSVEYVDTISLDVDEGEDDHVEPSRPKNSTAINDFRALCKDYFERFQKATKICFHIDREPERVTVEGAIITGVNAQSLLRWWQEPS